MSDAKFLVIKDREGNVVGEHDGYKTFMRQLADNDFRKSNSFLRIEKSGKLFLVITIPVDGDK